METLLIQYREFLYLIGHLMIAIVFLLIGYAMGRNSNDKPVVASPKPKEPKGVPYHDNAPDVYELALRDPKERIDTV